jgi:hypothetical protein
MMFGDVSEYYLTRRQMRFLRFACLLRDEILATLNDGLARTGARARFTAQIAVEGAVTVLDVDQAEAQLIAGERPFDDLLKPLLRY